MAQAIRREPNDLATPEPSVGPTGQRPMPLPAGEASAKAGSWPAFSQPAGWRGSVAITAGYAPARRVRPGPDRPRRCRRFGLERHAEGRKPRRSAAGLSGHARATARATDFRRGAQGRPAPGARPADAGAVRSGRRNGPVSAPGCCVGRSTRSSELDPALHPAAGGPRRLPAGRRRPASGVRVVLSAGDRPGGARAAARRVGPDLHRLRPVRPPRAALRPARPSRSESPGAGHWFWRHPGAVADLWRGRAGRGADQPVRAREPAVHHERL